jgi:hypothetical protein
VPDYDQDGATDRDDGFLLVAAAGDAPVAFAEEVSAAAEKFVASANGPRLRFTPDLGNIVMDTDDVERVTLNALGGADTVTVGDLRGTDAQKVDIDLGAQLNAGGGDSAVDAVTVMGTAGTDHVWVSGSRGDVRVS